MRRKGQVRAGFSLLEMVLAVAMSAILMGLIAAGLQLYTQVVTERNTGVTNAQLARGVLQQMSLDLRAAIYEEESQDSSSLDAEAGSLDDLPTTGDDGGDDVAASDATADLTNTSVASVPGIYGNQTELRIDVRGNFPHPLQYDSIVEAGGDAILENLISVDQVVTYYLRTMSTGELAGTPLETPAGDQDQQTTILVRRVQKRAEAEYESSLGGTAVEAGDEQLLSDRVVSLEFAYHDGYDWTESWDTELDGGLPIAVQITLTVADPNDAGSVVTVDNVFQTKVAIPTAKVLDDAASLEEL